MIKSHARFCLPLSVLIWLSLLVPLVSRAEHPFRPASIRQGHPTAADATRPQKFDPERLEREVLVPASLDPMQLEVTPGGIVWFIERAGAVKCFDPATREVRELGKVPVAVYGEVGLLGFATDVDFRDNRWIYLFYCPAENPDVMRLARFELTPEQLRLESQVTLLEYAIDREGAIHMGGGLYRDQGGLLYLGTGDNCPPIPELPVDQRPGRENFDAFRTSANTQDLRGKVLRIRPEQDGSYSIPAGNLFTDAEDGRPEIYAMGCRNPFRVTVDEATGWVYWGDVGPNIQVDLEIGPNGYDEIHRASEAGNFGWPYCVGPNEPFRNFDFASRQPGPWFDPQRPRNESRNNTGATELPPQQPALIWYPSGVSEQFPILGSGGRSAMAGPFYHSAPYEDSPLRLPQTFDGRLFIYEWTRNWIMTVSFDEAGQVSQIEPFLPNAQFRKPIDLEIGPDGALYLIEFGDKWGGNTDATLSRIVYRRGNRAPKARLTATPTAGKHPLRVQLDASRSFDLDAADTLQFAWSIDGQPVAGRPTSGEPAGILETTFEQPGRHRVEVRVRDQAGLESVASTEIVVGNARPQVAFLEPLPGSFIDWGDTVRYRIAVQDAEDGTTEEGTIEAARVLLNRDYRARQPRREADATGRDLPDELIHPGLALMRKTTCFSCHTAKAESAGPPYQAVGRRYATQSPQVHEELAEKIIRGGTGVWGNKPMPPHPQHTLEETRLMVDWILTLAVDNSAAPLPGEHGFFRASLPSSQAVNSRQIQPSVLWLTAEYTDDGAPDLKTAPPLRGSVETVLHLRTKPAASCDRREGAERVEVFEREAGHVMRFAPGDWIAFDHVRLADIGAVTWRAAAVGNAQGELALRLDAPDGPELARIQLDGRGDALGEVFLNQTTPVKSVAGLHDLYVVALAPEETKEPQASVVNSPELSLRQLSLAWLHFQDSPQAIARKAAEEAHKKKILLIPTELDHPYATHMYSQVCRLLAACLNQTPDVEAIVSPDLDWPEDPELLDDVDAIVYYSRPAGEIVLAPAHREAFEELLARGVGFTAIHWSTGADEAVGERYEEILGGWFNFAFSGLQVDRLPLQQLLPDHPVCRGWRTYELRDEYYLDLKFHPQAEPILAVEVNGKTQTVAWGMQRVDGGRSFGTTLGHFHDNYSLPDFRRAIVNGILWTAKAEVPLAGASVDIDRTLLELPPPPRQVVQEWTVADLAAVVDRPLAPVDFEQGQKLFADASCLSCHQIQGAGGKLGPDLSEIRVKYAAFTHPRRELLRDIVEPSHRIEKKYQTELFALIDGRVLSGLVVAEDDQRLQVATNPNEPEQLTEVLLDDIEDRAPADLSLMPAGLLNRFTADEIRHLLAYVEAGGQPGYFLYRQPASRTRRSGGKLAEWADAGLPAQQGLRLWLDASRINAAREQAGRPALMHGAALAEWPDASGSGLVVGQRQRASRPLFLTEGAWPRVAFDGVDDLLTARDVQWQSEGFTAILVVSPADNANWPGLVSGNAFHQNDYTSGFNIDLMPQATADFQQVMVEGPGYPGVINLMRETHPFGQPLIVTVVSQPGSEGVRLRINGRLQATRQRPSTPMQVDELSVAARYWSNDETVAAFNRGFFHGEFSDVILYDRPLSEAELVAMEVYLWKARQAWLDPEWNAVSETSEHP